MTRTRGPSVSGDRLTVHTRRGVLEVPLTGSPAIDELLEKWARKGGTVLRDGVLVEDPDVHARAAWKDGS